MPPAPATFKAIGTNWVITAGQPVDDARWLAVLAQLHRRIDEFDHTYSRFRPDSLVARMSQAAGTYPLDTDGYPLLRFYEQLDRVTDGKVTPLIGQTMVEAGYDANYSLQVGKLRRPPEWEAVLSYTEREITLAQPALLDFGAAGKGYLVDIVGDMLVKAGLHSFIINAGGDILHRSADNIAVEIGLENPRDTTEVIGVLRVTNQSICGSAPSKRQWQGMHHIIDPHTLRPADQVLATWVVADSAMMADGLATALFFEPPERLKKRFSFSYVILTNDMQVHYSPGLPVTFFESATA